MSSAFKYLTLKIVNVDFMSNLFASMKFVGATGLGGFWVFLWAPQAWAVCGRQLGVAYSRNKLALQGVAYSRNKLALRTRLRNLNLKSQFCIFDSFRNISLKIDDFLKFVGVRVSVANFF